MSDQFTSLIEPVSQSPLNSNGLGEAGIRALQAERDRAYIKVPGFKKEIIN